MSDDDHADAAREVVVGHDRRDGGHQADGRGDQRLGDAGRDGGQVGRALRADVAERVHDAPDGAEQADERRRAGGGAEQRHARSISVMAVVRARSSARWMLSMSPSSASPAVIRRSPAGASAASRARCSRRGTPRRPGTARGLADPPDLVEPAGLPEVVLELRRPRRGVGEVQRLRSDDEPGRDRHQDQQPSTPLTTGEAFRISEMMSSRRFAAAGLQNERTHQAVTSMRGAAGDMTGPIPAD